MSAIGAFAGLVLAIMLILKKIPPVYSLMLGALGGGFVAGMGLGGTVTAMISGVNDVTPAIVRVLAAGVLSGALVVSGAAVTISRVIVDRLGPKHVFLALALATMLLTTTGVFIDVAVITIAPIALTLARRLNISRAAVLVMMIGGGKCGNVISPNPNTIIAAENFGADLYSVMIANIVPAVIGLAVTVYVVGRMVKTLPSADGLLEAEAAEAGSLPDNPEKALPSFGAAISGPVVAILLLALRPIAGISVDPLIALPAGGLVGLLVMGCCGRLLESLRYGLEKMGSVAVLLIGTGTIAGIIKASTLKDVILQALSHAGLGEALVAPVSGMLMSAATASTTAGATVASASFADIILAAGISGVWGAAMVNAGATVFDHFPHGSFFHATGGVAGLDMRRRLRLIPYESLIGFTLAATSTIAYYVAG
ncbi:MAG: GntP family permease [Muribaculaceae bacterium]|nr:GntP family permease [Muribaculaceae bacterium]